MVRACEGVGVRMHESDEVDCLTEPRRDAAVRQRGGCRLCAGEIGDGAFAGPGAPSQWLTAWSAPTRTGMNPAPIA